LTATPAHGISQKAEGFPMSDNERRRRLDSVIPELIKRAVELGVEKAAEAPDNLKEFVGGMKLPREVANYLLSQVEETKNGLFRVVAKEIREFLEHTNLGGEMQKVLTTVQFEINTTIRFKPNEGVPGAPGEGETTKLPKPEVKSEVTVKRPDERPRERRRSRE
jgi:hypothetical protein